MTVDAGVQSDRSDLDERWALSLQEEMKSAEVELSSKLVETRLTLGQIVDLKAGDVIPIELPQEVVIRVEDMPVFRGQYGTHRGNAAIKITNKFDYISHEKSLAKV